MSSNAPQSLNAGPVATILASGATGTVILTPNAIGNLFVVPFGAGGTVTLPPIADLQNGHKVNVVNTSAANAGSVEPGTGTNINNAAAALALATQSGRTYVWCAAAGSWYTTG